MSNKNFERLTLEDEREAQTSEQRILHTTVIISLLLGALLAYNGHLYLCCALLFLVVPATVLRLWVREKEWAYRIAIITFKQQVLNLYIYSQDPADSEVRERASTALELLRLSGNTHGVKVWYMPFGSPYFFAFSLKGEKVEQSRHQVEAEIIKDFAAYSKAVQEFYTKDDFRRRVELSNRANTLANTDWLSQFVLNQN